MALFVVMCASAGPPFTAARAQSTAAPAAAPAQPLSVVVTIKPVHALAAAVLGDVATPHLLIEGAASPHAFALKPSHVRRLNEAQAVIMVSDELETFMGRVRAALPASVKVLELDGVAGLTRLPVRTGGLFEAHDDDHAGHAHASKAAKPGSAPEHAGHGGMDPHLWLDPENAKVILRFLTAELSALSPTHAETFERNARAMADRIDRVSQEIAGELQPLATKPFIVFHDAYQYFEHRYGLSAVGSITLNPEVQPGARRLTALRNRMIAGGAVCVFAEPQFEPKIIATLVAGTKVRKGTLDPIGVALPAGPDAYEGLLRGLASELRTCLGGTS